RPGVVAARSHALSLTRATRIATTTAGRVHSTAAPRTAARPRRARGSATTRRCGPRSLLGDVDHARCVVRGRQDDLDPAVLAAIRGSVVGNQRPVLRETGGAEHRGRDA